MDNLQGRNSGGSTDRFLQNNTNSENKSVSRSSKVVHASSGTGVAVKSFVATQDDCSCLNSVGSSSSWLTCAQQHMHNNNNNSIELNVQSKCNVVDATAAMTTAVAIANVTSVNDTTNASCTGANAVRNDIDGGGGDFCAGGKWKDVSKEITATVVSGIVFDKLDTDMTCSNAKTNGGVDSEKTHAAKIVDVISTQGAFGMIAAAADVAGTTSNETHACSFNVFTAAAVAAAVVSRSASVNNSTENLSFTSDNFYADDLLLLEGDDDIDDVDVDGEEISLNSDDCVYAYRGDGTDIDLALDPLDSRRLGTGNNCMIDDETDFLEMDFEPDPLSEVEYGSVETEPGHSDAFLMQRDACHLSGRHSATLGHYSTSATAEQRLLFSSPIDDSLSMPPAKTLQSQLMLSKNFARITMHLDQIKGENGDCDAYNHTHNEHNDAVDTASSSIINTAHSLPNTLLSNFGRDLLHTKEEEKTVGSALKVTGAKPKRLPTFSTSSSTSSKNSSKSRNSLRSTYAVPTLCNSISFDERSASCNEFRSAASKLQTASTEDDIHHAETTTTTTANDCDDLSANDDNCLDCLEKEFLANTIGKAMEPYECTRCRKRSISSMVIFKRTAQTSISSACCRSGSPLIFRDGRDGCIFEATTVGDFLQQPRIVDWSSPSFKDLGILKAFKSVGGDSVGLDRCRRNAVDAGNNINLIPRVRARNCSRTDDSSVLRLFQDQEKNMSHRRITADSSEDSELLLKNLLLTEKEAVTVSTLNLSEELLVQALEKLHVSYNLELIKSHLYDATNVGKTTTAANPPVLTLHKNVKDFKDLKDLLMYESKKYCNHRKLKRLIELATRKQVEVQFQQEFKESTTSLVPVKVSDILQIWMRTKNLIVLKQLDKRFIEANVLGKIANIIRQAQQRCTQRRSLPDYILIPQYYPVGILRLTKNF
ncbi:uncharacterized protein [Eurosta solidaginis]|uniref:uncharacterized protein n=1 Tax=Eurosta solidaginis TaxID=178769 RepID=UPI003530A2A3